MVNYSGMQSFNFNRVHLYFRNKQADTLFRKIPELPCQTWKDRGA